MKVKTRIKYIRMSCLIYAWKSTIEAIYILRQLIERYRENRRDLHMVFFNPKIVYDRIRRKLFDGPLRQTNPL